jgi:hypothetical protein
MGLGMKALWSTPWITCENDAQGKNHRTEATEVTEGEWGWGRKRFRQRHGLRAGTIKQFFGGARHKRDDSGSPGAGRAKLRLSRGFPRCLAHDVIH